MLKAWIISLRRKPKAARERIAFAAAAGVSALIFSVWAVTIPFRLPDQQTQSANVFGGLMETVQGELDTFKEAVPEPTPESAPEPTPEPVLPATLPDAESLWAPIATSSVAEPRPVRIATTTASGTTATE